MPFYHKLGDLPRKRHTQFRQPDGSLYKELVMGTRGFSGIQSIVYSRYAPTAILCVEDCGPVTVSLEEPGALRHRHFRTARLDPHGDAVSGRQPMLHNNDLTLSVAQPAQQMCLADGQPYWYRNGEGDELLFVHEGEGRLETSFGALPFRRGDYLNIPIGTTWRLEASGPLRLLVIETRGSVEPPRRYRNEYGQLMEHSPFCERDIRVPIELPQYDERGEFNVLVRARGRHTLHTLDHHPLDTVGWDGFLYPYAFNIEDFEPITGRIHQPPPVHQTFSGPNFVVCSFVPRLFDYHPQAIPAPYNHSNVDSDEVLYYVEGNFMSRRGVELSSITLHPSGLPHGPHPGTAEASIGKERTEELAVMVDTFNPLQVCQPALAIEDEKYPFSWVS
jgi:homogentisate 1,2-dioxygenase